MINCDSSNLQYIFYQHVTHYYYLIIIIKEIKNWVTTRSQKRRSQPWSTKGQRKYIIYQNIHKKPYFHQHWQDLTPKADEWQHCLAFLSRWTRLNASKENLGKCIVVIHLRSAIWTHKPSYWLQGYTKHRKWRDLAIGVNKMSAFAIFF